MFCFCYVIADKLTLTFLLSMKAESQTIRANIILNRKKEKVSRKYMPAVRRERQLSPGFLEDALEEVRFSYFHLPCIL